MGEVGTGQSISDVTLVLTTGYVRNEIETINPFQADSLYSHHGFSHISWQRDSLYSSFLHWDKNRDYRILRNLILSGHFRQFG
jgi:hypothetical protein